MRVTFFSNGDIVEFMIRGEDSCEIAFSVADVDGAIIGLSQLHGFFGDFFKGLLQAQRGQEFDTGFIDPGGFGHGNSQRYTNAGRK